MPRQSITELTFTTPDHRLDPPHELRDLEAEIFRETVASVPPEHFAADDLRFLCAYCRTAAMERRASEELTTAPVCADGITPSPWLKLRDQSALTMLRHAVRLRLGARARSSSQRTAGMKKYRSPSYYEITRQMRRINEPDPVAALAEKEAAAQTAV
jgi:hypothetical protein